MWLKGGSLSRLLAPAMSWQIERAVSRTLAAFKYLVEHGEAPPARHSRLPAARAA